MSTPPTSVPATYLEFDGLLSPDEHATLLGFARRRWDDLEPSTVNPSGDAPLLDPEYRRSAFLMQVDEIWPLFEERLLSVLPQLRKELEVPWFAVDRVERQLTVHGDGDYFRVHSDSAGDHVRRRLVTFVYYFFEEPRGFEGGELALYDGEIRDDGYLHPTESRHLIRPVDNRIVFFPSWTFHEVFPVRARATGFRGHRCTVNGWFRAREHNEVDELLRRLRRDPCG